MSEDSTSLASILPACSRLYALHPSGSGMVESLTSYIVRLAQLHGMTTASLVVNEYAPAFQCCKVMGNGRCDVVGKFSSALNGVGDFAAEGAKILERLTTIGNLDHLTLLPFRDLISPRSSVRQHSAWCPQCLDDWQRGSETVYSPLVWHLGAVSVCPSHQNTRLVDTCPHCRRQHFPLSRWSLPGWCPRCGKWLGESVSEANALPAESAVSVEANSLLEAVLRGDCKPSPVVLSTNLRLLQDRLYNGSLYRFAGAAGLNGSSILCLVNGKSHPGLETLLRISVVTHVPASSLVGNLLEESNLRPDSASKTITFASRRCHPYQWNDVRKLISQALKAENPQTLGRICKTAGLDPGRVSRALPIESQALIQRTRDLRKASRNKCIQDAKLDIQKAVLRSFEEKKRYNHKYVNRLLKRPGCFRSPELRFFRDQLVELGQAGRLPKVDGRSSK